MASVFKLGRNKRKRNAPWYFEFQDEHGKKRMRKGFTDKGLTEQLAVKLETEARLRRAGFIDPKQVELAEGMESSVAKHVDDFERSLVNRKNTTKHVQLTLSRVRRIVAGCHFGKLRDLSAERVESFLIGLRDKEKFGHRTYNHYLQAFEGFCNWLVKKRRLAANPVVGIERLNAAIDTRHQRRALSVDEFRKLILAAESSDKTIQCFSGKERAKIYLLSYLTGLRRGEIGSLTPRSFQLEGNPPTVTIEATISKHRRKDVLPLHPELIRLLRVWLDGFGPDEQLFPKLARRRTWLMVKKDLERAGVPYQTKEGIADFHAAGRHTHITELLRNGASLPEAKQLARHADINMTMRYTHIGIEDQARALRGLPVPCQDIVRNPAVFDCPEASPTVADRHGTAYEPARVSNCPTAPCDTDRQKKAPPDKDGAEWRRRESNPRPATFPHRLLRA